MKSHKHLLWAEIDLKAIRFNIRQLKKMAKKNPCKPQERKEHKGLLPTKMELIPVIKSNAYGHGMVPVARALQAEGVQFFAVSDVHEAVELRKAGFTQKILIFESTLPEFAQDILTFNLIPTISDFKLAKALDAAAQRKKQRVSVHVDIDTGMSRLGVAHDKAFQFMQSMMGLSFISVEGLYTHMPVADTNRDFTQKQIRLLYDLVLKLDRQGMVVPYIHAANSMGLAGYRTNVLNLARPGLMVYGLYPDPSVQGSIQLKPAMSIKTRIVLIKKIQKGSGISYGHAFVAKRDMTIAVLPIGYNDGYLRTFSNKASVIVRGKKCSVLGRVTMDQTIIDISDVNKPALGMEAVVMGGRSDQTVTADELAAIAQTINYEIVCSLGNKENDRTDRLFHACPII
ncbi:MAG: alanine racemase [Candidatus Omnitrophica bacterium]|nr:alanine racemase [Candidatus Omnitrophota bacterium]